MCTGLEWAKKVGLSWLILKPLRPLCLCGENLGPNVKDLLACTVVTFALSLYNSK